ncbi:hypothetical protein BMS3Bbin04_01057 [bacterium BMS3Bbin04]|nr:hypothetical protein BMS3Bbin04_01057 [bacterium BMS3Bbin04]
MRQPKISNLYRVNVREHQIGRFDVAVNNFCLMRDIKTFQHIDRQGDRFALRKRAMTANKIGYRTATDPFLNQ